MKSKKRAPEIAEINDLLHDLRAVLVSLRANAVQDFKVVKRTGKSGVSKTITSVRVRNNPRTWIPILEMIDRLEVTLNEQRRFYPF